MSILHLVKIRFDMRTEKITQEWLNARYTFFQEYTLKSLEAQTNQDWALWINCANGMSNKIHKLVDVLEASKLSDRVYFSFGDGPLEEDSLLSYKNLDHVSTIYVTRIDSDDLFSNDALQIARDKLPNDRNHIEASMFQRGYMYDVNNGRTGVYYNHSSPFHTLMIPKSVFIDREAYYNSVWSRAGDHSKVHSSFYTHSLPDWKFTVLIHGNNFISDFNYAREGGIVPKNFTVDNFIYNPVIFDVDDFCDEHNCLDELAQLKAQYPNFRCTLFTIPEKTSQSLLHEAKQTGYIELCPHGITHEPNEEMKDVTAEKLSSSFGQHNYSLYTKGFRPPGWYIHSGVIEACNEKGYWIGLHVRDVHNLSRKCKHGHYACGERFPYWHGHTHDTCGNWLKGNLNELLSKWDKNQHFGYVSEAVLTSST